MKTFDPFRTVRCAGMARLAGLILAAVLGLTVPAAAQVVSSADAGGARLSAGGTGSLYNLEYGKVKVVGFSVFVDADTMRHFGFEGEVRFLPFHLQNGIKQTPYKKEKATTYLGGLRYFRTYGKWQPYARCLFGLGQFTYPYNYAKDDDFVIAPGGGVDYKLTRRLKLRVNVEDQYWPDFHYGKMNNVGVSAGVRVRLF